MRKFMYSILVIIIIILVLLFAFIPLQFSGLKGENGLAEEKIQILAHRGASGIAPENTMPAFEKAIAAQTDYIELDVHLSKDNVVIVMHDFSVDRTTDGTGLIADLDSDYIKTLDAGKKFDPKYAETNVPFLEDVIKEVNGRAKLLIEIKEKIGANTGIEKGVVQLIEKYQSKEWCVVQSFNDESLLKVHQLDPTIELHKLIVFKMRFLPYVYDGKISHFDFNHYKHISAFNMHQAFVEKSFVNTIHKEGKKIFVWGCSSKDSCKLEDMNMIDGVITNYPGNYYISK